MQSAKKTLYKQKMFSAKYISQKMRYTYTYMANTSFYFANMAQIFVFRKKMLTKAPFRLNWLFFLQ